MFKRKRDLPEEFERAEDERFGEMTDDQLADTYDRSSPYDRKRILRVFRERTGQELK